MNDFISELQNVANKLRVMWGQNPDSDIIEKAVEALTKPVTKAAKTATKE